MDAIRREHEIVMTSQEAHAPANADQRDTLHLREWNLSALDGIKTQQNLDWIAARKTQVADRARETRSEEVTISWGRRGLMVCVAGTQADGCGSECLQNPFEQC